MNERGYALLGMIMAMTVMAIGMGVAIPNAQVQARRQLEIEMMYRGEQMAEAIARYYSGGGKVPPAGLVVKSPPPPYGYLTELKKLRDGFSIGTEEVFLVRSSAYIDPLTGGDWEPIRIGDPRLRKFFRAWVQATGRQLPPIYASYMGGSSIVDTTPNEADGQPSDEDADEDLDDEDDEEFDDEEDEGDDEEGDDEDGARLRQSGASPFVNVAFRQETPEGTPRVVEPTRRDPSASVFGNTRSTGPIIGVVSKARGKSIRTRFGMDKYEEMIFVYIPPTPLGVPGSQSGLPAVPSGGEGAPAGGVDTDGDGIPDNLEQNQQPTPKP